MSAKKLLFSAVTLLSATFAADVASAQASASVTLAVEFGVTPPGGGECVGKGVCDMDLTGPGTSVTFTKDPSNANVIIMTFSLSDLASTQPNTANYMMYHSSYPFDDNVALPNSLFGNLSLYSDAQITPSSNSTIVIDGDVVKNYITYSHN